MVVTTGLSVKDMERYLDEFDRYDSVWDTKPAWYVFARAFAFGKFESRKKRGVFLLRKTPRSFVHSGLRQTIKQKSSIVGSQCSNLHIQRRQASFAGRVCQSIFVQLHFHLLIVVMRFSVKIRSSLSRHPLPCVAIRQNAKNFSVQCFCTLFVVRFWCEENWFSIMSFRSFRLAESLDTLAAL